MTPMQRALASEGTNRSVCTLVSAGRRFEGSLQTEEIAMKTDLIESGGPLNVHLRYLSVAICQPLRFLLCALRSFYLLLGKLSSWPE